MTENDLPEQLRIRREKREALLGRGISPYPVVVPRTATLKEIRERHKDLEIDKASGVTESVTGRIIFKRDTGKLCFATLREGDGTELQAMFSLDKVGEQVLEHWKSDIDLGDIVSVTGEVITSKRGELSILANSYALASKALRPLPNEHNPLSEETRARQRYVDLIVRPEVAPDDRTARQIAEKRQAGERHAALAKARKKVSLEDFLEKSKVTTLNLILKGDVSGSVEALEDALVQLDVGTEVDLRVIHRGVGAITKSDVTLASASGAVIVGFNVKPEAHTAIFADEEGVEVRFYSVIYKAIEEIEAALKGLLKPEFEEATIGTAEVREIFKSSKFGTIAGSMVSTGIIKRNAKVRVLRDGVVVGDNLTVESLKRFKDDATEVREGFECGIGVGSFKDLRIGDVFEVFEMREKKRA